MPKKKRVIWKIVAMVVFNAGTYYITNSTGVATVGNTKVNKLSLQLMWAANIVTI